MKIASINVGKPKPVNWHGKIITTGIFKEPVEGSIKVRYLNIEGDQQANLKVHGGPDKAVYAYPTMHYPFWRETLGQKDLPWGQFGQNLDIEGDFQEDQVNVGDQFQIGTAEFMAVQPRFPCMKLGVRLGDAAFVKMFLQAQRPGIYFQVIKEGDITTGDLVKKIHVDQNAISILDIFKLHTTEKDNQELIQRAIELPHLPKYWKDRFQKKDKAI